MSSISTATTSGMSGMMTGMPMAGSSMGGMDGMNTGSGSMNSTGMPMSFMPGIYTPLWSAAWAPKTTGQYAGTCIFLIFFGAVLRALLAVRTRFSDLRMLWKYGRGAGRVYAPPTEKQGRPRWKASDSIMLAFVDVVVAGVVYLLMIAVMTLNVGYFLSVLAGIFVGSVLFNHYIGSPSTIC